MLAARQEFSEHGLSGARVDDIVDRAGVNKQLLYYYFGDKEALYEQVLEQAYADIRIGEENLNLDALAPREALEKFITYNFEFIQKNRYFVSLLNDENLHLARHIEGSDRIYERHNQLKKIIGDLLERGYAQGVFALRTDPVDLYVTISSLSYFYFSNIHTMSTIFDRDLAHPDEIDRRKKQIVDIVLRSLKTCVK